VGIDGELGVGAQINAGFGEFLEALEFDRDVVLSGREVREDVESGLVGLRLAGLRGAGVLRDYRCIRDDSAAGIEDRARDSA
jgi:hypothetical protein